MGATGSSLVAQWLGLSAFTTVVQVQSLICELRFYMLLHAVAKKKKKPQCVCNLILEVRSCTFAIYSLLEASF